MIITPPNYKLKCEKTEECCRRNCRILMFVCFFVRWEGVGGGGNRVGPQWNLYGQRSPPTSTQTKDLYITTMTYKLGLCVARSAGEYVAYVTVVAEVTNRAYTCRRTAYR